VCVTTLQIELRREVLYIQTHECNLPCFSWFYNFGSELPEFGIVVPNNAALIKYCTVCVCNICILLGLIKENQWRVILPSHLYLRFPNSFFPSGFHIKFRIGLSVPFMLCAPNMSSSTRSQDVHVIGSARGQADRSGRAV